MAQAILGLGSGMGNLLETVLVGKSSNNQLSRKKKEFTPSKLSDNSMKRIWYPFSSLDFDDILFVRRSFIYCTCRWRLIGLGCIDRPEFG